MAAFEDVCEPDLDLFAGRSWSDWQDARDCENGGEPNNGSELSSLRHSNEVAKLKRKDFGLFGFYPAKDNFYVVVCEHCHLPIKPQAFHHHIEKHHKGKSRTKAASVKEDIPVCKSSPLSIRSFQSDQSTLAKSPTPSESSDVSSGSLNHSSAKGLHKYPFFTIKREPMHKHDNPVTMSHPKQDEVLVPSDLKWKKQSSLKNQNAILENSSSVTSALDEIVTKRNSKLKHQTNFKQSSKHGKHTEVISNKSHKVITENLKTLNKTNQSLSSSKHYSQHHHHFSGKLLPKSTYQQPPLEILSASSEKQSHGRSSSESMLVNNRAVVVLEKSPVVEEASTQLYSPLNIKEEIIVMPSHTSDVKRTSISSAPYRQYKHHHNPQLDIVKTSDRGSHTHHSLQPDKKFQSFFSSKHNSTSLKKTSPLKAREYDPNKHCGVVASDGVRCTHSLTCKAHPKSIKRKVPGRKKPYDELLVDYTRTKQRLKAETGTDRPASSWLHNSTGGDGSEASLTPFVKTAVPPKYELSSSSILQNKTVSSSAVKTSSQSSAKAKSSIHLFPRSNPPRHTDLWQDSFIDQTESKFEEEQTFLTKHPVPLAMRQYQARTLRNICYFFNRKEDFQWRTVLSATKDETQKKTLKQNFVVSSLAPQAGLNFTPISSVPTSLIEKLKSEKEDTLLRKQQECLQSLEVDAEMKFTNPYAHVVYSSSSVQLNQSHCQTRYSKSLSVDCNSQLQRDQTHKPGRLLRDERHTVDSLPGPPLPKSPRRSMQIDHRLSADIHTTVPSTLRGEFVQLSTPSSSSMPCNQSTLAFNYLVQTHGETPVPNNANATFTQTPTSNQHPRLIFQGLPTKSKRTSKARKISSCTGTSSIERIPTHNSLMQNNLLEDLLQNPLETESNVAAVKQEIPLVNGMSTNAFACHKWPQSVTLSGTIGALMQTSTITTDGSRDFLSPPDIDQFNLSSGNFNDPTVPCSANNTYEITQQPHNLTLASSSDSNSTSSSLQQKLLHRTNSSQSALKGQLLAEAAARTVFADVSSSQYQDCMPTSPLSIVVKQEQTSGYREQWSSELLSLLDPGGEGKTAPRPSHDLTSFTLPDDVISFSNEPSNIAELSNT